MKTYCVYMLRDPQTFEVRYVGMSYNPARRLWGHLYSVCTSKALKAWIGELAANGQQPVLDIRITGLNKEQALRCESILVSKMRDAGHFDLIQGYVSAKRNPQRQLELAISAVHHLDAIGIQKLLNEINKVKQLRRAAS